MEKMFIHIKKGTTFTEELKKQYTNSIVFDDNTGAIWTHEKAYGSVEEALEALKYFSSVAGNTGTATPTASKDGTVLNVKGKVNDYVETVVDTNGVTIQGTQKLISELADAKATGTAASSALETYKETNDAAVKAAKAQADKGVEDAAAALAEAQKKVATVKSGSNGIAVNGTATDPTVALKIDTTTPGNVTLTETANGLAASVVIPEVEVPVKSVKTGDKVLKLEGTELSTTITFKDDKTNKKIQLVGIDEAVLGEFSYADFIIDGMLQDVQYDQDTHKISFVFNTDAGDVSIDDIDLSDLVDRYEAGLGIKFTEASAGKVNKIEVELDTAAETAKYLSLGAAGLKLSGVDAAIAAAKAEAVAHTVNGKAISSNPVLNGGDVALTGYVKGDSSESVSVSDTVNEAIGKLENRIEAAKSAADNSVQNVAVTNGTYVSATVTGTTTKTIAINDSAIETLFTWLEL